MNYYEAAKYDSVHKYPVFVILMHMHHNIANTAVRLFTGDKWTHVSISFNESLSPYYSFGRKSMPRFGNGYVKSEPKSEFHRVYKTDYEVYVMYVTKDEYAKMLKRIKYFDDNKDNLSYDYVGLLYNLAQVPQDDRSKWFCSRFVMDIIKSGGITIPKNQSPSLFDPQDALLMDNISLVNSGDDFYNYDKDKTRKMMREIQTYNRNERTDIMNDLELSIYEAEMYGDIDEDTRDAMLDCLMTEGALNTVAHKFDSVARPLYHSKAKKVIWDTFTKSKEGIEKASSTVPGQIVSSPVQVPNRLLNAGLRVGTKAAISGKVYSNVYSRYKEKAEKANKSIDDGILKLKAKKVTDKIVKDAGDKTVTGTKSALAAIAGPCPKPFDLIINVPLHTMLMTSTDPADKKVYKNIVDMAGAGKKIYNDFMKNPEDYTKQTAVTTLNKIKSLINKIGSSLKSLVAKSGKPVFKESAYGESTIINLDEYLFEDGELIENANNIMSDFIEMSDYSDPSLVMTIEHYLDVIDDYYSFF